MTTSLSLRARLTVIILAPLLVISLAVAIWASRDAQLRAADRFDRSLLVTALGISRDTAFSGGNALSRETRDLLRDTSGGPAFYHVYAPDGVFVTGYATPPVPPSDLAEAAPGAPYMFFDAEYRGEQVRAVRFSDRMTIDDLTGEFTFTVWQELSLRDGFVQSLSERTYGVMATLVLAVALIVWFGVRLGMGPLLDLEDAIARRSAEDLTPIRRPIPMEVRGIAGRLNALFAEMSEKIRAKDAFISDAAHQLRNPVAGVVALADAVAAAKTLEESGSRSQDLREAARHAAKLTEDLLAFERAKSAAPGADLPSLDLGPSLQAVLARMAPDAAAHGVSLTSEGLEPGASVRIDPTLFEQAVTNLVTNAMVHGGAGLTRIDLRLERLEREAKLTVADDGQGIAPADFETALSRFAQVSPSSGSGLGLPIAKTVVEKAGGRLDLAEGEPGLIVSITLPLADCATPK